MSKKTIVHLIQSLDNGGCENMLLRTLPLMKKFNHVIITLNRRGELANKFEEKGIRVININQKSLADIFSYRRLNININDLNPGLIITYLFHADLIGRLYLQPTLSLRAKRGNPVHIIPYLRTTYNHNYYWQARIFEKISKNLVYKYIANSEAVKEFYVNQIGVERNKITVIPNGIDIDYYNSISKDLILKKKLGIKKSDKVIICVANFHINKGHKYLLEAFEDIYKTNKNIKLLLVGDGAEKDNLKNQIKHYHSINNIRFLGKRNDVPFLLKISDMFVLPTLFEGMSNAIMEAMVCGLAIVVTNIPENKILLENNSGYFVKTEDSSSISKTIKIIINNPKTSSDKRNNAVRIIKEKFRLDKIAKIYSNTIKSLLK